MSEYRDNFIGELSLAINTGFIDSSASSAEEMRPKLLTNDYSKGSKVLSHIIKELENCTEFMFSIAFITNGGLTTLLNSLKDLEKRGIKGKILTTNYQNFNNPKLFRKLLTLNGMVEVKVYDHGNFHTKGYIFKRDDESTIIIGSSNLTQEALTKNNEWNLKINSSMNGSLVKEIEQEFNTSWSNSKILTNEWINEYEVTFNEKNIIEIGKTVQAKKQTGIQLNKMQRQALEALSKLRESGKDKAILISATGTGKTYLSAFDAFEFKPKKFLFLIHRENVAKRALKSFQKVFGEGTSMGLYTGHKRELKSDFIFATIQTFSKDQHLNKFDPTYFDYIVVDEVHRAGADSYTKVLDYFKPKFLLGMSATPERNDSFNIFKLFDYNIAYEIRLKQAMEEDMLCPFHYFGISEIMVGGEILDDKADFAKLTSKERIKHIAKNVEFYGYSGDRVRGLIFCSQKEEAKFLSNQFNEIKNKGNNYRTVALTGESSEEDRQNAIDRLEQEEYDNGLDYIFTVDIFNEGVDIPKVNQVVMLRPTQSAIIFIQQLGRGLRKAPDKEYVIVLDFIGNYANNYMISIALSGDRTYNKDNLRKFVTEGSSIIPGCSTVNLDKITRNKIFESIDKARFSQLILLKSEYQNLKSTLNQIPTLNDFYDHGSIDPQLIHDKTDSYYVFKTKYDQEFDVKFTDEQKMILKFATQEFAAGERPHEIIIVNELMKNMKTTLKDISRILKKDFGIENDEASISSAASLLEEGFLQTLQRERYKGCTFLKSTNNEYLISEYFKDALSDNEFINHLKDLMEYSMRRYENNYAERHENNNLTLYQKYSRKEACRLLNWDSDESSTIYGYKIKHNTCPIFVTYEKQESISYSTQYEDKFINRGQFSWMTRSRVRLDSIESIKLRNQSNNGLRINLFVKKKDGENSDHYYLGELIQTEMIETIIKDKKSKDGTQKSPLPIVNVQYQLKAAVREDIYDYLHSANEIKS
jgi:superfamily II DNA or RNA helicase